MTKYKFLYLGQQKSRKQRQTGHSRQRGAGKVVATDD